jgi:adenine-specific DNA-methyltransferase
LNVREEANRKFILVELEDYAEKVTAGRIRHVVKEINGREGVIGRNGDFSFTFCSLGEALDLERFFQGDGAPSYEQVGRYVAYTATGQAVLDAPKEPRSNWFVAEVGAYRVHLIYKPDLAFMRSNDAALSMPIRRLGLHPSRLADFVGERLRMR